jgi:Ca2+/H+ antiporter
MTSFNWLYGVLVTVSFLMLALMLVAFIGFFRWRYYAWLSLMIFFAVLVAFGVLCIAMFAVYIPEQIGMAIGQLIATLIYAVPIVIYYLKRRPLFTSKAAVPVQAPRRLR